MKKAKKPALRVVSFLLTALMLVSLVPSGLFVWYASAEEDWITCDYCGETMPFDDWAAYHAAGDCILCGECYGEETQCPECGYHMCEEIHCPNGHCLEDSDGECPCDVQCEDSGDYGYCSQCCQEAYDATGHDCGICPNSSEWEDHFCIDHGCCFKDCEAAGGAEPQEVDDIYCPLCGHCYKYSWECADHECDVHDCPCECTLCEHCGNCIESSACEPCEDCGAPCNCECEYCDICGMCLNCDDHEVCEHCGKCITGGEAEPCEFCGSPCNCTCEPCPYCGIDCVNDTSHDVCPICGKCMKDPSVKACASCGAVCDHSGTKYAYLHQACKYCGIAVCSDAHKDMVCPYCGIGCIKDPAHQVCEYCGKCLKDPAVKACSQCGARCDCECVKVGYCPYCGSCRNTRTACWTCGAVCSCRCDNTRCPNCGLCENGRTTQYGRAYCDKCGLCPCLCKCKSCSCDKTRVEAYKAPEIMNVTVRVKDGTEDLAGVPIYAENSEGRCRLIGYTHKLADGGVAYTAVIKKDDAAQYKALRACSSSSAEITVNNLVYNAPDSVTTKGEDGKTVVTTGARSPLTYKQGSYAMTLTLTRTGYQSGIPTNVSFILFDDPEELAYLNNCSYSVWADGKAHYAPMKSAAAKEYRDAFYSSLAWQEDVMAKGRLLIESLDGSYKQSFELDDVLYETIDSNYFGVIATVPSGTYRLSVFLDGHVSIIAKEIKVYPDYKSVSSLTVNSADDTKLTGNPDSVYYLGCGSSHDSAHDSDMAYPYDKFAPGWDDSVTAVTVYMRRCDLPDVRVELDLGGLTGSALTQAAENVSVTLGTTRSATMAVEEGKSSVTFNNITGGTYSLGAVDSTGTYVFAPSVVTTTEGGRDQTVTLHGYPAAQYGTARIRSIFTGLGYALPDGALLLYTVTNNRGEVFDCGTGHRLKSGYANSADSGDFSVSLPAGSYYFSSLIRTKDGSVTSYGIVRSLAFTVSPGGTVNVDNFYELVTAVGENDIFFSTNASGKNITDVKTGAYIVYEFFALPQTTVMSGESSVEPFLKLKKIYGTDTKTDIYGDNYLPVSLPAGSYTVRVSCASSFKLMDYKGTSVGYEEFESRSGKVTQVSVTQQDPLDLWRISLNVTDAGTPLAGAEVKLESNRYDITETGLTDSDGHIELWLNLPMNKVSDIKSYADIYTLSVRKDGYNGGAWIQYNDPSVTDSGGYINIDTMCALAGLTDKTKYETQPYYDKFNQAGTIKGIYSLMYSITGGDKTKTDNIDLWHIYGSRYCFNEYCRIMKNDSITVSNVRSIYKSLDALRTDRAWPVTFDLSGVSAANSDNPTLEIRDANTGELMTDSYDGCGFEDNGDNHRFNVALTSVLNTKKTYYEVGDETLMPPMMTGSVLLPSGFGSNLKLLKATYTTFDYLASNSRAMKFVDPTATFTDSSGKRATYPLRFDSSTDSTFTASTIDKKSTATLSLSSLKYGVKRQAINPITHEPATITSYFDLIDSTHKNITITLWMVDDSFAQANTMSAVKLVDADTGAVIADPAASVDLRPTCPANSAAVHVDESVLCSKFTVGDPPVPQTGVPFVYSDYSSDVTIGHGVFPVGVYNELGVSASAVTATAHASGFEDSAETLIPKTWSNSDLNYFPIYMRAKTAEDHYYTVRFLTALYGDEAFPPQYVKCGNKAAVPDTTKAYVTARKGGKRYDFDKNTITGDTVIYVTDSYDPEVTGMTLIKEECAEDPHGPYVYQGEQFNLLCELQGFGAYNDAVKYTCTSPNIPLDETNNNGPEPAYLPKTDPNGKTYPFTITATSVADPAIKASVHLTAIPKGVPVPGYGALYNLTVDGDTCKRKAGTAVNETAAQVKGKYIFDKWEASGVTLADPTSRTQTFNMPEADVTITPKYKEAPAVINVTGLTLSETSKTLTAAGQSFTLTAAVTPDNATDKLVTFTSSDLSVAVVDAAGNVTAVANGKTDITVKTDDGGFTAVCSVTVNIPAVPPVTEPTTKTPATTKPAETTTAPAATTVKPAETTKTPVTTVPATEKPGETTKAPVTTVPATEKPGETTKAPAATTAGPTKPGETTKKAVTTTAGPTKPGETTNKAVTTTAGPTKPGATTLPPSQSYILGDLDGDGQVTAADARLALRIAVSLDKPTDIQLKEGEVDGDAQITAADARLILRYAVGLEKKFPIEEHS